MALCLLAASSCGGDQALGPFDAVSKSESTTIIDAMNTGGCGMDEACLASRVADSTEAACKIKDTACLEELGFTCHDEASGDCTWLAAVPSEEKIIGKVVLVTLSARREETPKVEVTITGTDDL